MKKIIIIMILLIMMPFNVQAFCSIDNKTVNNSINENVGNNVKEIEELYEYISNMKTEYEILKDYDIKTYINSFIKSGKGNISLKTAANALFKYGFKEIYASMQLMGMLVIISIMCALLNNLQKAFSNEKLSNIAYFACYSLVIIIMTKSFYSGVEIAKSTINKMSDFMTALIPVLVMLLTGVGGVIEAAVLDPFIVGVINLNTKLYSNFIIPLILITFALQFVNNLSDEYKIDKLTKLLNQIAVWTQGIVMTIFIGIVTVRGFTTKTIDQVTAKTAKYAVDNFIPIVGKCLSDAIATVAGYSLLLKNAISSLGLVVLIVIVIFPIIKIFIMSLMYKLTAAVIEPISDKKLVNCIGAAGDSLTLIMSCLISVSVMFFIMIAIIATAGKAVIGG